MAQTKQSTKPRKTSGKKTPSQKKTEEPSRFQNDILFLMILAASLILFISVLGFGGIVGNALAAALFGVMGRMAYLFPLFLFFCLVLLLSNRKNFLAVRKVLAILVFLACVCAVMQHLSDSYYPGAAIRDAYVTSSEYHTGGGIIGGAICFSTTAAFGRIGSYIILTVIMLICLIVITQRSFFGFLYRLEDMLFDFFESRREAYRDSQPERALRKEWKEQQRIQRKEERKAKRIQRYEQRIADGEEEDSLQEESIPEQMDSTIPEEEYDSFIDAESSDDSEGTVNPESSQTPSSEPWEFDLRVGSDPIPYQKPAAAAEKPVPDESGFLSGTWLEEGTSSVNPPVMQELHEEAESSEDREIFEESDVLSQPQEESAAQEAEEDPYADADIRKQQASVDRLNREKESRKRSKASAEEVAAGVQNVASEIVTAEPPKDRPYQFPPTSLLHAGSDKASGDSEAYLRKTAQKLQETLYNFGVNVKIVNISCGPTVTRYELQPEMGVKVSKIVSLSDDIKLNLACADIRIEAPIPGKAAIGIEVPNKEQGAVPLRSLLESPEFKASRSRLSFAAGKDIAGKTVVTDIAKMPHLLIAGATGSGKSVCINTLIVSILYKADPNEVKLIMIDPKVVELSVYNGIPHLLIPVVTDPKKAAGALNWAVQEMTNRYNTFAEFGVRNLGEYNKKIASMRIPEGQERPAKLPQMVIIVDELADLMMVASNEVEDAICRLAQLARAAGIHLIIATQRPSVNVITGLIKANMPSRVAFAVSSGVDSRTILDMNGAEKLLGKGDMLFYPQGYPKPARLQGAFISDEEVSAIVDFLKKNNPRSELDRKVEKEVTSVSLTSGSSGSSEDRDTYFIEAGRFIIEKDKASIGMLQRMFKIGFNRAARIMDQLSEAGVVGPEEGTKPRQILMSEEQFENYIEQNG